MYIIEIGCENMDLKRNIMLSLKEYFNREDSLSQKELAVLLDVKEGTVSKWISGAMTPDINKIPLICKSMNVTITSFLKIDEASKLSDEDIVLINNYKSHPEMQDAVNKLLGLK